MSESYKNLSTFEIRAMIKALVDELDRREIETMNLNKKIFIQQLRNYGLSDEEINQPDLDKVVMKQEKIRVQLLNDKLKTLRTIHPKYRHPKTKQEWAGRGAFPPKWVLDVIQERKWTLDEFKRSDEFRIKQTRKNKK